MVFQLSTSSVSGSNVLRTVYMPSKNVEAISFEIESVRLQAAEQKRLWKEKEEVLLEDRRVKEAEFHRFQERHYEQVLLPRTALPRFCCSVPRHCLFGSPLCCVGLPLGTRADSIVPTW